MSTKPKLASGRSPRWVFMEWFEVPDYDGDGNYLTRLRIVQTPWFGVYLHRFDGPDPRPTLHDHPWNFVSVVLRGGYTERRLNPMDMTVNEKHRVGFLNVMRTHDAHAIVRLWRVPTWTLMFVGHRVRTWGYLEPWPSWSGAHLKPAFGDPPHHYEWTWTEFDKHRHAAEFDAAVERRKARA